MTLLAAWAMAELMARESGTPVVPLLTLWCEAWGGPLRLVKNSDDVVSRGETYKALIFDLRVVTDTDQMPVATLVIPNIDPEIGRRVAAISGPVHVTIEVVSLARPDEPIYRAARLELRGGQITPLTVSGELTVRDYGSIKVGTMPVVPATFPAFFGRGA